MPKSNYGLGFSPLSMANLDKAFPEEMVSNKDVGMFGIVTDKKEIISHEYIMRTKMQLDAFITRLTQDNTLGKVYKINPGNMATIIKNNNTNLVQDANLKVNNGSAPIFGVRFNFDVDLIHHSTSSAVSFNDITVDIVMNYRVGFVNPITQKITGVKLSEINTTAYRLDPDGAFVGYKGDANLTIDSIVIHPGENFDYDNFTVAVYDILFATIDGEIE